jgi:choline dehydrogenase-like flavoprotein
MFHNSKAIDEQYDVCVVGAGPVGLTVALECEAAGLSVLLLEAGQAGPGKISDRLGDAEFSDPARHAPLHNGSCSGLGGTSELWGGRCVPFDDIDFEPRPFVRNSTWPVPAAEIERYCPSCLPDRPGCPRYSEHHGPPTTPGEPRAKDYTPTS